MEEETIQAFFGIFFQFSNKSLSIDESITKIKAIIVSKLAVFKLDFLNTIRILAFYVSFNFLLF